jgi:hypothetical protein
MKVALAQTENSAKPRPKRLLLAIRAGVVPSIETQIKEIRAIDPPRGEGWQVTALIVALEEGIYSENHLTTSPHFKQAFAHSAEIARALGPKACVYNALG